MSETEVVVTGIGVISPIGIGCEAFWTALAAGRGGAGRVSWFDVSGLPAAVAAEVRDFDPKPFVANRKSLKVMSRDAQLGVAAAALACREAGIARGNVDPERLGVVLGADRICGSLSESVVSYCQCMVDGRFDFRRWGTDGMLACNPLGFLSVLPNMIASHVSIAQDARGPNNTIHQEEMSSALAVSEAASVIRRGAADVMMAGGASSQMHLFDFVRRAVMGVCSRRGDDPVKMVRPFDAGRDGQVWGEGAAILILENRDHARARGAKILARLLGCAATCEPAARNGGPSGASLARAIDGALQRAAVRVADLDHVNAHGLSTLREDPLEAAVLHAKTPDTPVTALKSYFGNLGAAGAAMQMAASVLSFGKGLVPATLNYEQPDPMCPIRVIHGAPRPFSGGPALCLAWMPVGQAAAVVLAAES
jgi:3-oxoacyl-[acyl-carrier-protein] synthase II